MKILICGTGSIANRHYKNLIKLGYKDIIFYKSTRKKILIPNINKNQIHFNLDSALKQRPKIVFICNVTSSHISTAIKCAKKKCNIFLEKPLSNNLKNLNRFKKLVSKNKSKVFVGYMMRFHPLILKLKKMIDSKIIKNIFYVNSVWGEYLPNWHRYENYETSYAAQKKLGGGAALTLSHEIDLMSFLFGDIQKVTTLKSYKSKLKLKTDYSTTHLIRFKNEVDCSINVNFLNNPPYRKMLILSENYQIFFDYFKSELILINDKNKKKIIKNKSFNRNNLFIDELKFFFKELGRAKPNFNLENSIKLMNFIS
jgi:predicted dehydrogenase